MSDAFTQPHFQDPEKARLYLERQVWPRGPICPHCGGVERITKSHAKTHRAGLYYCGDCREQFTVTVGSLFESSKVPLNKWLLAVFLLCSSKKGMSAHQLHRTLGVTYKTAWFMSHRIREAMKPGGTGLLGGSGSIVEADETYVGGKEKNRHRSKRKGVVGAGGKQAVFSLVERGGQVRSVHIATVSAKTLRPILAANVDTKNTHLVSDDAGQYRLVSNMFKSHEIVNHTAGEYVRGSAYTNTVEGYFSILKRGIIGTFHHVSEQHLQRYATEFDFRYNTRSKLGFTDAERTQMALKGIPGRRLTYRRTNAQQTAESA